MPGVILTLEKKSPLDGRNQLLWTAGIVRIIRFSATGQCDSCCVVKIIVPDRVEPTAASPRRAGQLGTLRFILADKHDRPLSSGAARFLRNRRENMFWRAVEHLLRRIEAQAIEMKLFNPIACVRQEEFANSGRIVGIEIDRFAPFILISVGEVSWREFFQIIPVRAKMVVNYVQHNSEPHGVRAINEGAEIVGSAVEMCRRK